MSKKFYVCIIRGTCDPETSEVREFDTSEEVQKFLLLHGEYVDSTADDVWVIFGERFRFDARRKPVEFRLRGPDAS